MNIKGKTDIQTIKCNIVYNLEKDYNLSIYRLNIHSISLYLSLIIS